MNDEERAAQITDMTLVPEVMIEMYIQGAFPMAESAESTVLNWYCPETRTVIPMDDFNIPRSLRKTLEQNPFSIKCDTRFEDVISGCADRSETWINQKLKDAYARLFSMGILHTVEVYREEELLGGLYGLAVKGVFFGESMFSRVTQASKAALVFLLHHLRERGYVFLDVQMTTEHLLMFGAKEIPFSAYKKMMRAAMQKRTVTFR